MNKIAIFAITLVSHFFRLLNLRACRFHPTCSAYSIQAFRQLGFFRALGFMTKRLFRCHPLSAGGYDPLPNRHSEATLVAEESQKTRSFAEFTLSVANGLRMTNQGI